MKRAYTTTHTYEAGRDGLLEMKNELNVGLVTNPNTTPMTRGNPWTAARHQYELNTLGQRTSHEETLSEAGNFNGWVGYDRRVKRDFVYDAKGQVTAATAAYPNGNNASAGYGFLGDPASEAEVYSYDAIGNRTGAQFPKRPVDASGNLQYDWSFGTPPATGESNTYPATSKANTYGAINRTNQGYASGTAPPAAATLKYDADGNLLEDGEFLYTWDSENRLLSIDPVAPTPGAYGECRYRFGYDYRSRRVRRQVDFWAGIWLTKTINRFVYHGWNLALDYHQDFCVYNDTVGQTEGIDKGNYGGGLSPVRTDRYIWGQDVSGTLQGAGGVGGLLMAVANPTNPWWFDNNTLLPSIAYSYLYDGNGNVTSLLHEHGFVLCQYRYDSFGNQLGQCINHYIAPDGTIPCLMEQPFRFSTKWLDQTDGLQLAYGPHPKNRTLYYYGYRYYTPQQGRWLGRDPIEEDGGVNLFGMVGNAPVQSIDFLGLWSTKVHEQIAGDWLDRHKLPKVMKCGCCTLQLSKGILDGSDWTDGVGNYGNRWTKAQAPENAYMHGMRGANIFGVEIESVNQATEKFDNFISENVKDIGKGINSWNAHAFTINCLVNISSERQDHNALLDALKVRKLVDHCDCLGLNDAVFALGKAFHAVSDSTSPAHKGFQKWNIANGGKFLGGPFNDATHAIRETMAVYRTMVKDVLDELDRKLGGFLDAIAAACKAGVAVEESVWRSGY